MRCVQVFLAAIISVLSVQDASACRAAIEEAKLEDIEVAAVIVKGVIVSHKRMVDHSLFRIRVTDTWKGEVRPEWEIYSQYWSEDWTSDTPVVIAGVWSNRAEPPLRGPSSTIYLTKRTDMLQVLQARTCSAPFVFPAEPTMRFRRELESDRGQRVLKMTGMSADQMLAREQARIDEIMTTILSNLY